MASALWQLWLPLLPVMIAGCVHMAIVTLNLLPWLAVPLNEQVFGRNKTWRGFIVVPLISLLVGPQCLGGNIANPMLLGGVTGLGYMLGELPNSALKRRLGIPPGEQPTRYKGLFMFLDQADSGVGVALGCQWVLALNWGRTLALLVMFIITVPLVKYGLFRLSLKKSRF